MNAHLKTFIVGLFGVTCVLLLVMFAVYGRQTLPMLQVLAGHSSRLLTGSVNLQSVSGGFLVNIVISVFAMMIAMVAGCALGLGMISPSRPVRYASTAIMNVFRNSPWLVILYAMLYLLPFEFALFDRKVTLSPSIKAVIGLSLPVMANMAEIFRGSIETIHVGQWESARALGYKPLQVLRHVIVPQAVPRMIPNVMNLYAMLVIGTSLIVVTGTEDVLSVAKLITATQGERVATALYLYVLFLFFIYCFPIAILSRWKEQRIREAYA